MRPVLALPFIALMVLGATSLGAEAQDVKAAGKVMTDCYLRNARAFGAQSCQPPPAVVGAVLGECSREESRFREQVINAQIYYKDSAGEVADDALNQIREGMKPMLESKILRAQIKRKCP